MPENLYLKVPYITDSRTQKQHSATGKREKMAGKNKVTWSLLPFIFHVNTVLNFSIFVLSGQSEHISALVPVGVTTKLEVPESTRESPRAEYEEIELFLPAMMVYLCLSDVLVKCR